jgi:hypothetical protein
MCDTAAMLLRRLVLPLVLFAACAPAPRPAAPPAPAPLAASPTLARDQLAADASYGDLVRAAAELGDGTGSGECLLARTGDGFRLRAELASGVRPLPLPSEELASLLKQSARVELLSAWGRHGDGSATLGLVGFTLAAPARDGAAVLLTQGGLSVRGASGSGLLPRDALDTAQAMGALAQLPDAVVFVAAEARTPLARVADLLAALGQARREVVLAVNLGADTRLPRPPTTRVARCPEGLPPTDQPEGSVPTAQLMAGVAPLTEAAADCLGRGDARGAAGGRLRVGLRIDATGRVAQACVVHDELGDDAVAGCVTELAGRLSFPSPSPAGVLDVELPVVLRPRSRTERPPLCAP